MALATISWPVGAHRDPGADEGRKEQFVYNFLLFVTWPADAFQSPSEAVRVQIIGRDPFHGGLDRLLAGKSLEGRRIVLTHASAPTAAPLPHMLFVSAAEESRLGGILAAYCRAPVLTISDLDRFAERGGVIGLVEQELLGASRT